MIFYLINKNLLMVTRGYYEEYNLNELKESFPQVRQNTDTYMPLESIEEKLANNDDRFLTKTWTEAYKMAAYYYTNPLPQDRLIVFNKFRFHFGELLQRTYVPNEIPDMRSRNDFVGWVCKKHNQFLEKEDGNFRVDCSNVERLVNTYGPNYNNVKAALGEYEFYY
jgi:hypothetical protein